LTTYKNKRGIDIANVYHVFSIKNLSLRIRIRSMWIRYLPYWIWIRIPLEPTLGPQIFNTYYLQTQMGLKLLYYKFLELFGCYYDEVDQHKKN
jgi:hypothetical protein